MRTLWDTPDNTEAPLSLSLLDRPLGRPGQGPVATGPGLPALPQLLLDVLDAAHEEAVADVVEQPAQAARVHRVHLHEKEGRQVGKELTSLQIGVAFGLALRERLYSHLWRQAVLQLDVQRDCGGGGGGRGPLPGARRRRPPLLDILQSEKWERKFLVLITRCY